MSLAVLDIKPIEWADTPVESPDAIKARLYKPQAKEEVWGHLLRRGKKVDDPLV